MASKKKTQAPEEELLVLHEKWVNAAKEHLKEIIIGAVAVVFIAVVWAGYQHYRSNKENKAALLCGEAVLTKDLTEREKIYQEVLKRYKGTGAALEAHLGLYEIYAEKEKFKKALEELLFLKGQAKQPWRAFLDLGVGYLQEDLKALKEARKEYQAAWNAKVGLESVASLDLARVAELTGDYQAATKYYQAFVAANPQGADLDFVQAKLDRLMAKVAAKAPSKTQKEGE